MRGDILHGITAVGDGLILGIMEDIMIRGIMATMAMPDGMTLGIIADGDIMAHIIGTDRQYM